MNNFNRGGGGFKSGRSKFDGGGRPREGKRFGGSSSHSSTSGEMFKATCSDCGKVCEVPFRPNGEKPVFCSDCFGRKQSEGNRGDNRRHDDVRPRPQFKHAEARPIEAREQADRGLSDIKKQLANLEQKLNRILDIINPPQSAAKASRTTSETDNVVVVAVEKKVKPKTLAKKTPSVVEIKAAINSAMINDEGDKEARKALSKVKTKKVVAKKVATKKVKK